MARGLNWLLAVPLLLAGSESAHWFAYLIVTPDGHDRAVELAQTGHGYLGYVPLVGSVSAAVVLVALARRALDPSRYGGLSLRLFALAPPLLFVVQEHVERAVAGHLSFSLVLEPAFAVGLLFQLPFGLLAYALSRSLLWLADEVGDALDARRISQPAVATAAQGAAHRSPVLPRTPLLALGYGERGPPVPIRSRRWRRRPSAVVIAAVLALAAAPAASAHAILVSSEPSNAAVLAQAPSQVTIQFNEPVETAFGSIRVYDSNGGRVDSGKVSRPAGDSVRVDVGKLGHGTFTVAWRVVSADTHPVHGAFVFSVGKPSGNAEAIAARVLQGQGTPWTVSWGFAFVRGFDFALILACAGGALALLLVRRHAEARVVRRLLLLLGSLSLALVVVAILGVVFQGASAGGFGVGQAFHWSVFSTVAGTRFGEVWLARAGIALVLAVLAFTVMRLERRAASAGAVAMILLGAGLVVTPTAAGHASIGGPAEYIADAVHVAAGAAWTGGLAFVVLALLLAGADRWRLASLIVPRFSAIAFGSVVLLLAAGIVNGYLEVRAWRGLWDTTYGQLLLAKIGLVLPLIGLGAYNKRKSVPKLRAAIASTLERRRFLQAAGAELALFVVIVGVTAVLVTEPPAKGQVLRKGPFATTTNIGPFELNLIVDPARAGANAIHAYTLSKAGQPVSMDEVHFDASLPGRGISKLPLTLFPAGPGHYTSPAAVLPIPGTWELEVTVRKGDFDEWTTTIPIPIQRG